MTADEFATASSARVDHLVVAEMVTPGTTPPLVSTARPDRVPEVCADAVNTDDTSTVSRRITTRTIFSSRLVYYADFNPLDACPHRTASP